MRKPTVSPIVKALALNFVVSVGMHIGQKYVIRAVDDLEYKFHQGRKKQSVGFAPTIGNKK